MEIENLKAIFLLNYCCCLVISRIDLVKLKWFHLELWLSRIDAPVFALGTFELDSRSLRCEWHIYADFCYLDEWFVSYIDRSSCNYAYDSPQTRSITHWFIIVLNWINFKSRRSHGFIEEATKARCKIHWYWRVGSLKFWASWLCYCLMKRVVTITMTLKHEGLRFGTKVI
jgi:hypothetical protein